MNAVNNYANFADPGGLPRIQFAIGRRTSGGWGLDCSIDPTCAAWGSAKWFNGPRLAAVGPSGGFVLMATIDQGYAMKDRLWLAIQSVAK